jgi:hypothetical protein
MNTLLPTDRMPPLALNAMDDAQREAAEALIAGPRRAPSSRCCAALR